MIEEERIALEVERRAELLRDQEQIAATVIFHEERAALEDARRVEEISNIEEQVRYLAETQVIEEK